LAEDMSPQAEKEYALVVNEIARITAGQGG
jgi:hypothetical protein